MAATAEQLAFLRAVVADPDDDTRRLAYADWLDEHDDAEQAEYIRLSVRLAALDPGHPDHAEQSGRWNELYRRNGTTCVAKLGLALRTSVIHHRGLPAGAAVTDPDAFFAEADTLLDLFPIQGLTFVTAGVSGRSLTGADVACLASMPYFRRVRSLQVIGADRLTDYRGWDGRVPDPPAAPDLRLLRVMGCGLGDAAVRWLAGCPWLAGAVQLDLGANPFGPDGARALCESPVLGNLTWLGLPGDFAGPDTERSRVVADLRARFGVVHLHPAPDEDED